MITDQHTSLYFYFSSLMYLLLHCEYIELNLGAVYADFHNNERILLRQNSDGVILWKKAWMLFHKPKEREMWDCRNMKQTTGLNKRSKIINQATVNSFNVSSPRLSIRRYPPWEQVSFRSWACSFSHYPWEQVSWRASSLFSQT